MTRPSGGPALVRMRREPPVVRRTHRNGSTPRWGPQRAWDRLSLPAPRFHASRVEPGINAAEGPAFSVSMHQEVRNGAVYAAFGAFTWSFVRRLLRARRAGYTLGCRVLAVRTTRRAAGRHVHDFRCHQVVTSLGDPG